MNKPMTSFERMVCPFGHQLTWRGRWIHLSERVVEVFQRYDGCPGGAVFPRSYWKSA